MKRIQRKRSKGWRMPPNTVYVGRPSKFGNPYPLSRYGLEDALQKYKTWVKWKLEDNPHFLDELHGKDLACWCPLDKPCHADILIEKLKERPHARNRPFRT